MDAPRAVAAARRRLLMLAAATASVSIDSAAIVRRVSPGHDGVTRLARA